MSQKGTAAELGTERIGKLLMQYAIPAIIAMTASSLYNMVDSIFIGHGVGPLAISGLAITFPLMNLAAAFGSLVGVGASTLISVKLGQKDYTTAQQILGNVVSLNLIIGVLFTIVCLLFLDPILYFFGASEATLPYAKDYMVTILLGNVITHMYLGLNSVLRSAGHPQKAMAATILTVIINTLLDPLFIYTFHMGIKGAAVATVLAQVISLCWLIWIFCNKNELLHFRRGIYRLKRILVENIIGIGLAPVFHEPGILLYRDSDKQRVKTIRRRFGHRCIWNRQPHRILIRHDCDGAQPRNAAHCRLQLWCTELSPCKSGNEIYRHRCHYRYHQWLLGRRTDAGTGRSRLHHRFTAHPAKCQRLAGSGHVLPYHRLPDGYFQLLPKYRNGQESHHTFFKSSGTDSDSLSAYPSAFLGSRRSVVQYADF